MRFNDITKLDTGCGGVLGDYQFLYGLVALLRPALIVEIGTNTGVSAIAMALAMKENDIKGNILTFDISSQYKEIADKQIKALDLTDYITTHLGNSTHVTKMNYDLGFIDGDHTYDGVKKDFEILKHLCQYIIFHDTKVCEGVAQFIQELNQEQLINITDRPKNPVYSNGQWLKYANFPGIAIWRKS